MARKNNSTQPWNVLNPGRNKKNRVLLSTFVNNNNNNTDDADNSALLSKPSPPIVVTQDIMAQRSRSFAYGTRSDTSKSVQHSRIYAALLSKVALEFRQRIVLTDNIKDDIEYKNTFDGKEAVDKIAYIIHTSDRQLALRIGRTLSEQRFFHDVSYETQLVDSALYFYEFSNRALYIQNNDTNTSSPPSISARTSDWSESGSVTTQIDETHSNIIPTGVVTELTHCYVPTCWDTKPCYSPICPKRLSHLKQNKGSDIVSSLLLRTPSGNIIKQSLPTSHDLWADSVDKDLYNAIAKTEKKRQENIYELIYTEEDYVHSLEYLQTMWIKPLMEQPIIPLSRRESFVNKLFAHISSIYDINICMLEALRSRQKENPVVYQIGDILLAYVSDFEPYIKYGSKQYEAKFTFENELFINPNFSAFVEETERHPSSLKLELNGYLTKPTTRLGRYTLLFNEILKHTPPNHPDQEDLPKAVNIIKQFLSRVNAETGRAKNRFDLERISYNLSFKHKSDEVNLDLLNRNRSIIKQGLLKRSPQLDSSEYLVILFDHYLVVVKIKLVNGQERYVVQKKPIPVELLSVHLPDTHANSKRSSTMIPYLPTNSTAATVMVGHGMYARAATDVGPQTNSSLAALTNNKSNYFPISFRFLGGRNTSTQFTLFATSLAIRKPWIEKIRRQQEEKDKRRLIFEMAHIIDENSFYDTIKISHFITFNGGNQYLFAANDGVYVGHHNNKREKKPHKVLSIVHVTQVHVIESTQTLLVLAERVLWEYPLDVVNGKPENQPLGYRIQSHVPFFYVGQCMQRFLVCVPRVSTLKSTITAFEPIKKTDAYYQQQSNSKRNSSILDRLIVTAGKPSSSEHPNLKKVKDCYVPSEAYRIELSPSMMLITTARGIIMVDMRTDKPQQLLNPADKSLGFILEREKEDNGLNLRQPIKHISIFRTPRNHYFVCYDEYAFYIDGKGNRLFPNFLIEWEGSPEAYAFSYPYVMAFDSSFIEIRNVISGGIEQIIRGKNIRCLNNGNKTELPLIFVTMTDPLNELYRVIFSLQLTQDASDYLPNTYVEPSTLRRYKH